MNAETAGPNVIDVELGSRIRARRRTAGVTQAELAGMLNLSFQQVRKYERGQNRVSASVLVRCARALECSIADLVGAGPGDRPGFDAGQAISEAERAEFLSAFVAISPDGRAVLIRFLVSIARPLPGALSPGRPSADEPRAAATLTKP